jgi:hypothetical protein
MGAHPPFFAFYLLLEAKQAVIPETLQELPELDQSFRPRAIEPPRAFCADGEQSRAGQYTQVLRDSGARHVEPRGYLAGGALLMLKKAKDLAAMGFGNGVKNGIEHETMLAHAYEQSR